MISTTSSKKNINVGSGNQIGSSKIVTKKIIKKRVIEDEDDGDYDDEDAYARNRIRKN